MNTPDILTEYLQFGGRPAYKLRAALAATASPLWGVYAGYELFEDVARPGSEENIDNEKYEYKQRDWEKAEAAGASLAPYLTVLNGIRRAHPALAQLRNLRVHWSDDESILVFTKYLDGAFTESGQPDGLIVVANVDPHSVRETTVHLDLSALGLEPGATFSVRDLITGANWIWTDSNYVRLDAFTEPGARSRGRLPEGTLMAEPKKQAWRPRRPRGEEARRRPPRPCIPTTSPRSSKGATRARTTRSASIPSATTSSSGRCVRSRSRSRPSGPTARGSHSKHVDRGLWQGVAPGPGQAYELGGTLRRRA